jgi:hypothetical protein
LSPRQSPRPSETSVVDSQLPPAKKDKKLRTKPVEASSAPELIKRLEKTLKHYRPKKSDAAFGALKERVKNLRGKTLQEIQAKT